MEMPRTPVERLQDFRPPFCPRRGCKHHKLTHGFRYWIHGSYRVKSGAVIKTFRCLNCRSTFGAKAFSVNYYSKRPELLLPIAAGLVAGSAHRQLARSLGCAPSTVTRTSARLGRHAMLLHLRTLAALAGQLNESVVFDHFEVFELTQDLPFGVGTPVGAESWFVYGVDPAPHGRAGKRTPAQQRRLERRAKRNKRGGYDGSTRRVLDRLLPLCPEDRSLRLVHDGHKAYRRVIDNHPSAERIEVDCHPNPLRGPKGSPRSAAARARDEAMFPVDLLHGILRHTLAAHRRETIAFGRRLNAIMERLHLAAVWRNLIKGVSERKGDRTTPAMKVGLTDRPWTWKQLLSRRLFPDREGLDGSWLALYRRDWLTPELPSNTLHRRVFAY